ncbi:MAG: alpha/beta hydrolase [Candidatus Melainabacteria bacterium]|nr:alpha/beta hydrolase [Candidatus Melainabacteria bacterium]
MYLLRFVSIFALALLLILPGFTSGSLARTEKARDARIFIVSDRATLKLDGAGGKKGLQVLEGNSEDGLDSDQESKTMTPYGQAAEGSADSASLSGRTFGNIDFMEGKLKSAFFSDNGHDKLTWLATRDDESFKTTDLDSFLRACRGKKVVLFVHGCCVSFKEMERQARDLDLGLKGAKGDDVVLLAYDWATPAWFYPGSLKNMETTQVRFNHFMEALTSKLEPGSLCVVMHSLGANLMVRYLTGPQFGASQRSNPMGLAGLAGLGQKTFHTLIFSRPDMSLESFRPHLAEVAATAENSIILAAENDININLSGFVRSLGGKTFGSFRLGQMHNARELFPQMSVMDVGSLKLGHKIPYQLIGNLLGNL